MARKHAPKRRGDRGIEGRPRLWGRHAAFAALDNPARTVRKLWVTSELRHQLVMDPEWPVVVAEAADLGRMVPNDAPHQGIVVEVDPLDNLFLADVLADAPTGPIVVLDQVTDPHNVGAILRSAAAFDAAAIVTQDRHSPPEGGTVARAASGALEVVPWVRVVNLARALDELADAGYWRIGLDGAAELTLAEAAGPDKVALVLGAEGEGMRHNTAAHCDAVARLPIGNKVESLNVSNAAAIALYEITRGAHA